LQRGNLTANLQAMRIRVLHLITDLEIGGAPLFVRNLVCGMDRSDFEVQVACLGTKGPLVQDLRDKLITTHALGAKGPWDMRVMCRLARVIGDFRPHILHCTLVHANVAGRIVGNLCNVPHIVGTIQTAEQGKKWHLTAENFTCRWGDMTICVSQSVYRHTRRLSHVPPSRLCVIPNAIDCDRFAQAKPVESNESDILPGKTNIIFVGRLDPVKNIDILIRAIAPLTQSYEVQLLILGDGPEKGYLEKLTADLNLANQVKFMGPRRDVERWLKSADIFVLPSKWEGLSISTLEAMAAGLPIIASRTTGLVDMIKDGKTGLLVGPGEVKDITTSLEKYLLNPEYAAQLAKAAQIHVCRHYSLTAIVEAHERLYKEVMAV